MAINRIPSCCGVGDYTGISNFDDPVQALKHIINSAMGPRSTYFGIITFSDVARRQIGFKVQKLIEDMNLGKITVTSRRHNPNSSNKIVLWVWEFDHTACQAWLKTGQRQTKSSYLAWMIKKKFGKYVPSFQIPVRTIAVAKKQTATTSTETAAFDAVLNDIIQTT